jgi:lysozyme
MFRRDIAQLEKWLNTIILRENTKQHQFDAIASWTYNVGHGAAFSSTLMKKYNMGADENAVAKEFNTWVYVTDPRRKIKIMSRGLAHRRKVESSMFMEGQLVYF